MNDDTVLLNELFELVHGYIKSIHDDNSLIANNNTPQTLAAIFDTSIHEKGISSEHLLSLLELYLSQSVKTGHKYFCNQLYGGFNITSFIAEIVTSLTSTSMYTYEVAPIATLMEIELIKKMNRIIGFKEGNGQFVSGGSSANLVAALCARNKKFPELKYNGLRSNSALTIFASDQAHYSLNKAANLLGIGSNNLIKVPSDHNGCMRVDQLEKALDASKKKGDCPFLIVATAGTTVLGAFDPIEPISKIAKTHDIWLHVDGALCGSVLLSESHAHLLTGIHHADSLTWDPHKMMSIPLICSVLLVKDHEVLNKACACDNDEYLFHDHEFKDYDLGKSSIQCGRRADVLKLWFSWKYFGDSGYEFRINKLFKLTDHAVQIVQETTQLELVTIPQSVTVCFRYIPDKDTDLDKFNLTLRNHLVKSGNVMINYSYLKGRLVIRLVIINPDLEFEDIDYIFNEIIKTGDHLNKSG